MSLLKIVPPINFYHAGNLYPWQSVDPRPREFEPTEVRIDLRKCTLIWPAAVVWCACYALLVRHQGRGCEVIVPEDTGVAAYLKSMKLFSILKDAGVEVDDRGVGEADASQIYLPLSRFSGEFEAEQLTNAALESLTSSRSPSPALGVLVSESFAELAFNAAQHAQSPIGALGLIQFDRFQRESRFTIVVGDGGIGIRNGLANNPELRDRVHYDWTIIELATRERVTGTGDETRGIGLFTVAEDARKGKRHLVIHSGNGVFEITEDVRQESRRTRLYPGTLVSMSIATL